jgi:hypothetical protein
MICRASARGQTIDWPRRFDLAGTVSPGSLFNPMMTFGVDVFNVLNRVTIWGTSER